MHFLKKSREEKILHRHGGSRRRGDFDERVFSLSRFLYWVLLLLFIGVTIYVFFFSDFMKVQSFSIEGVEELPYEEVLGEVKSKVEGKYLGLIEKNNLLLISKSRIKSDLLNRFKKIKSAEVRKEFPSSVCVKIEERSSLIVWCSGGPCYIIDERGLAYTGIDPDAPEIIENNLIKIIDKGAQPVSVGEKVLTEDEVAFLLELREEFRGEIKLNIYDEWETPSIIAEEVRIKTSEDWYIYFSTQVPPNKAIRTLKTFLEEEISAIKKRKKLEYVDLRTENKVYYKMKVEEKSEEKKE